MKTIHRLAILSSLALAACASQTTDAGDGDTGEDALIGTYTTPDPGNIWTRGVDLSQMSIGQENVLANEEAMFDGFANDVNDMQRRLATMSGGPPIRGFHAKGHGCVKGQLRLNVPDALAGARVGLFAENTNYDVWVRYSNGTGFVQADKKGDVRGLALKVLKVPGKKLMAGEEDAGTHDFLMTNGATTPAPDSRQFVEFGKAITDARVGPDGQSVGAIEGMLKTGGWLLRSENKRTREYLLSRALPRVLTKGTLLGEQFWTGGAFALGTESGAPMTAKAKLAAKLTAIPGVFSGGKCKAASELPDIFDDDYLRHDLRTRMAAVDTCIDVRMQLQRDPAKQPIEDTSVEWLESDTPFVSIGYVYIPKTDLDSPANEKSEAFCNGLSFTPWHARVENRPLGNIMRARLKVYESSRKLRGGAPEPTGDE